MAKQKIHELVARIRLFMKDAVVAAAKIDSILLSRLDKVRKIMETNGTFIQFPALASQRNMVRIQGIEGLHVERTVRDIMSLVSNSCPCGVTITDDDSRLDNSTARRGGFRTPTSPELHPLQMSELCYLISAPILMQMCPLTS